MEDTDKEMTFMEQNLKRSEIEPLPEMEVPDYLTLGTFDLVKKVLESDTLKNKESSEFELGTVSKVLYTMEF